MEKIHSAFFKIIFGLVFIPIFCSTAIAACDGWQREYKTLYTTICYSQENEIDSFTKNIGRQKLFYKETDEKGQGLTKNRVDRIVERVAKILDMYPANLKFRVYIYPTYKELEKAYFNIDIKGIFEKIPIAFYLHKKKAIYLSLDNITDGVFAHEVAHAVINFYFPVPPPPKMQEILAQYVDKHLWEE